MCFSDCRLHRASPDHKWDKQKPSQKNAPDEHSTPRDAGWGLQPSSLGANLSMCESWAQRFSALAQGHRVCRPLTSWAGGFCVHTARSLFHHLPATEFPSDQQPAPQPRWVSSGLCAEGIPAPPVTRAACSSLGAVSWEGTADGLSNLTEATPGYFGPTLLGFTHYRVSRQNSNLAAGCAAFRVGY